MNDCLYSCIVLVFPIPSFLSVFIFCYCICHCSVICSLTEYKIYGCFGIGCWVKSLFFLLLQQENNVFQFFQGIYLLNLLSLFNREVVLLWGPPDGVTVVLIVQMQTFSSILRWCIMHFLFQFCCRDLRIPKTSEYKNTYSCLHPECQCFY